MKKLYLSIIGLLFLQNIIAQSFTEVCMDSATNGTLVDFVSFNDTIYATGFFNTICDEPVGYIAKWENDKWIPSGINISDPGHAFEVINNQLYLAKYENSIDSNWVYVYQNGELEKVGQGVYLTTASGYSELPNIYDVVEFDGRIIACGEFDRVGQEDVNGIMQLVNGNWEPMGAGLTGNITSSGPVIFPHQMLVHDGELYVAGNFINAGQSEVNGIAKWDGNDWLPMGDGFNGTVYSLVVYNNELIAGGSFTASGVTEINRIAKWSGTEWVAMDFGFTPISNFDFIFVHTLKVIDGELYLGGGLKEITYTDGSKIICNGIVKYANGVINTFNEGIPGNDIEAIIKTSDEKILIGGGVFGNGYAGLYDIETNTQEIAVSRDVKIYPNPVEQIINISTSTKYDKYIIQDRLGNIMDHGNFKRRISMHDFSGIYFLSLTNEETRVTVKVIKL